MATSIVQAKLHLFPTDPECEITEDDIWSAIDAPTKLANFTAQEFSHDVHIVTVTLNIPDSRAGGVDPDKARIEQLSCVNSVEVKSVRRM